MKHYAKREQKWEEKFNKAYLEWDELKMEREHALESFINAYHGEIMEMSDGTSVICDLPDSFSARLKINGKCLLDLVMNFPYIFEASESEEVKIGIRESNCTNLADNVNIIPSVRISPCCLCDR